MSLHTEYETDTADKSVVSNLEYTNGFVFVLQDCVDPGGHHLCEGSQFKQLPRGTYGKHYLS